MQCSRGDPDEKWKDAVDFTPSDIGSFGSAVSGILRVWFRPFADTKVGAPPASARTAANPGLAASQPVIAHAASDTNTTRATGTIANQS
jgi:hypothetical protein